MNLVEYLKMSLDNILNNKVRSFLTMLGIIIGISSVITIVSLGEGARKTITGEFEKIGSATINISLTKEATPNDYIKLQDIKYIKEKLDSVKYITPIIQGIGGVTEGTKDRQLFINGGTEDLNNINNEEIIYGRTFNEREVEEGTPVVVISSGCAKRLFGYEDVVGKRLKVISKKLSKQALIIGVVKSKDSPFMKLDKNEKSPVRLTAPYTFVQDVFGEQENPINFVEIMATSKENLEDVGNKVQNILEYRHHNKGKGAYKVESMLKQLEEVNKVIGIFTTFIGAVAAISLLVGGIGVMNIMLVSVTERTREIGIRKALGATTKDIMLQFLTESTIISVIGGLIGMIFGILVAHGIGTVMKVKPSLSLGAILIALLFSSGVGIFFGIYPAKQASKLNPIDALRYE